MVTLDKIGGGLVQIGTFGDLIFEVSNNTVRTFSNLNKRKSGRWEVHLPINAPPKPQFLGPNQGLIELDIHLNVQLGINPREEEQKIDNMVDNGLHAPLMLGGIPIGDGNWYIAQAEATYKHVDAHGLIHAMDVQLAIGEYPIPRRRRS